MTFYTANNEAFIQKLFYLKTKEEALSLYATMTDGEENVAAFTAFMGVSRATWYTWDEKLTPRLKHEMIGRFTSLHLRKAKEVQRAGGKKYRMDETPTVPDDPPKLKQLELAFIFGDLAKED